MRIPTLPLKRKQWEPLAFASPLAEMKQLGIEYHADRAAKAK